MRPARIRARRRLLAASALPALAVVMTALALISVVIVGGSARRHYDAREIADLRQDVALLQLLYAVEPANAAFAAGGLAVLDDRLGDADTEFSAALQRTDPAASCAVRVNLELVRERRGDIDAWEARLDDARQRYVSALSLIAEAPAGCFEGNTDPDPRRRAVRQDAAGRVRAKLDTLGTVAPVAPAPAPPPPPTAPVTAPPPGDPDPATPDERRLDLDGDPLEALRQILRDAAG